MRSPTLGRRGCPIRRSPDHRLCSGSTELFAATYVLHRLLTPRHPPCALSSLTSLSLPKGAYSPRDPALAGPRSTLSLACQRTWTDGSMKIRLRRKRDVLTEVPQLALRRLLRKEVIQPQVPLRLPCYDFTPVANQTLGACLLAVSSATSGPTNSHGVTGGVYKARERIHRGMLIRDY